MSMINFFNGDVTVGDVLEYYRKAELMGISPSIDCYVSNGQIISVSED